MCGLISKLIIYETHTHTLSQLILSKKCGFNLTFSLMQTIAVSHKSVSDLHNGIHFIFPVPLWLIHVSQTRLQVLGGLVHGWGQHEHCTSVDEIHCTSDCRSVSTCVTCVCVYLSMCLCINLRGSPFTASRYALRSLCSLLPSVCVWNIKHDVEETFGEKK